MRNKKEKGSSASKQPIRERYHAPMITITHSLENVKENFPNFYDDATKT